MALRTIRQFDDPILKKRCKDVSEVDDRVRMILDDMLDTLRETPNGTAIAANQVGVLRRLVVIEMEDEVYKLVNPVVTEASGEQVTVEGCLSFPGIWGTVRRPDRVVVEALDENGENVTVEGEGIMAKCLCHELDHLDGAVFTDKIEEYVELGGENE